MFDFVSSGCFNVTSYLFYSPNFEALVRNPSALFTMGGIWFVVLLSKSCLEFEVSCFYGVSIIVFIYVC
ncbi:unnamed protein product [Brassica napus]|uniref:(rape) hypothetical protein n=1 Tax=Brassica napus TaxID=3708 RepID=A0A816Q764_BRANA|nr:unnamed protein product [Brassica napus]